MQHPQIRVDAARLVRFTAQCFEAEGLVAAQALIAAEALVAADRRGVATHGVLRIPLYVRRLRAGLINPVPDIKFETRMPVARVIHADNGVGMVAARMAIDDCIQTAGTFGIGAAVVRQANHFGAASVHTIRAARSGCIGFAMSPAAPTLAPHGSGTPLFGTNPFAAAAPAGRFAPWSLDIAASVAARGRLRVAERDGKSIPEGWALNSEGHPTTDPKAALAGVMLPFGGAKGSGIAMMVDILGGVLSGSALTGSVRDWVADFEGKADVGHFFLALKVEAFMPLDTFGSRMETSIARLKALPPSPGFDEILYPGERAGRAEADADANGVPVSPETVRDLSVHAREVGIDSPF